jgi:hypothetical protein
MRPGGSIYLAARTHTYAADPLSAILLPPMPPICLPRRISTLKVGQAPHASTYLRNRWLTAGREGVKSGAWDKRVPPQRRTTMSRQSVPLRRRAPRPNHRPIAARARCVTPSASLGRAPDGSVREKAQRPLPRWAAECCVLKRCVPTTERRPRLGCIQRTVRVHLGTVASRIKRPAPPFVTACSFRCRQANTSTNFVAFVAHLCLRNKRRAE